MSKQWEKAKPSQKMSDLQNLLGTLHLLRQTCLVRAEEAQKQAAELRERALKEAESGLG